MFVAKGGFGTVFAHRSKSLQGKIEAGMEETVKGATVLDSTMKQQHEHERDTRQHTGAGDRAVGGVADLEEELEVVDPVFAKKRQRLAWKMFKPGRESSTRQGGSKTDVMKDLREIVIHLLVQFLTDDGTNACVPRIKRVLLVPKKFREDKSCDGHLQKQQMKGDEGDGDGSTPQAQAATGQSDAGPKRRSFREGVKKILRKRFQRRFSAPEEPVDEGGQGEGGRVEGGDPADVEMVGSMMAEDEGRNIPDKREDEEHRIVDVIEEDEGATPATPKEQALSEEERRRQEEEERYQLGGEIRIGQLKYVILEMERFDMSADDYTDHIKFLEYWQPVLFRRLKEKTIREGGSDDPSKNAALKALLDQAGDPDSFNRREIVGGKITKAGAMWFEKDRMLLNRGLPFAAVLGVGKCLAAIHEWHIAHADFKNLNVGVFFPYKSRPGKNRDQTDGDHGYQEGMYYTHIVPDAEAAATVLDRHEMNVASRTKTEDLDTATPTRAGRGRKQKKKLATGGSCKSRKPDGNGGLPAGFDLVPAEEDDRIRSDQTEECERQRLRQQESNDALLLQQQLQLAEQQDPRFYEASWVLTDFGMSRTLRDQMVDGKVSTTGGTDTWQGPEDVGFGCREARDVRWIAAHEADETSEVGRQGVAVEDMKMLNTTTASGQDLVALEQHQLVAPFSGQILIDQQQTKPKGRWDFYTGEKADQRVVYCLLPPEHEDRTQEEQLKRAEREGPTSSRLRWNRPHTVEALMERDTFAFGLFAREMDIGTNTWEDEYQPSIDAGDAERKALHTLKLFKKYRGANIPLYYGGPKLLGKGWVENLARVDATLTRRNLETDAPVNPMFLLRGDSWTFWHENMNDQWDWTAMGNYPPDFHVNDEVCTVANGMELWSRSVEHGKAGEPNHSPVGEIVKMCKMPLGFRQDREWSEQLCLGTVLMTNGFTEKASAKIHTALLRAFAPIDESQGPRQDVPFPEIKRTPIPALRRYDEFGDEIKEEPKKEQSGDLGTLEKPIIREAPCVGRGDVGCASSLAAVFQPRIGRTRSGENAKTPCSSQRDDQKLLNSQGSPPYPTSTHPTMPFLESPAPREKDIKGNTVSEDRTVSYTGERPMRMEQTTVERGMQPGSSPTCAFTQENDDEAMLGKEPLMEEQAWSPLSSDPRGQRTGRKATTLSTSSTRPKRPRMMEIVSVLESCQLHGNPSIQAAQQRRHGRMPSLSSYSEKKRLGFLDEYYDETAPHICGTYYQEKRQLDLCGPEDGFYDYSPTLST
ncbi:unnamed protein product [Amoebophrya sp. A25]|nr:unnamed protein product [Amoebophrya sp. A25]|eukprot:GSA25T00010858001.1